MNIIDMIASKDIEALNIVTEIEFTYDTERNLFIDEDGFPVWDIYEYISPKELYLFRQKKEYTMIVKHKENLVIHLIWPFAAEDL